MNCVPLPLPTFLAPEGSKGGPPLEAVAAALAARSICGASDPGGAGAADGAGSAGGAGSADGAGSAGGAGAADGGGVADRDAVCRSIKVLAKAGAAAEPPPKPQPVFPC